MKEKRKIITLLTLCLGIASAVFVFVWNISAQNQSPAPVYNPYPPGILPGGLDSEIARVLREIGVSSKVELLKGGTPYRRRHDCRSAQDRIRPFFRAPELNQSKHSASLCFSTRTCRPAEMKRARLATCRMPVGADRSRQ